MKIYNQRLYLRKYAVAGIAVDAVDADIDDLASLICHFVQLHD